MRLAARTDANHQAVASAYRKCGCSVQSLAALGDGVPDLLIACRRLSWLVEVKDGGKAPSRRKLTDAQMDFHNRWRGAIYIIESAQDVPGNIVAACRDLTGAA